MKRFISCLTVLGLVLGISGTATAATGVEKQTVIDNALAWLAKTPDQQKGDGRWVYNGSTAEDTAATSSVLLAFIEEKQRTGWLVDYTANVENGMNFLLTQAQVVSIAPQTAGNPDSDGNGIGVKFVLGGSNSRDTYTTGLAVPAIAKYIVVFAKANDLVPVGPLVGRTDGTGAGGAWTYKDVVVNAVDYFAFGQNDVAYGSNRGGWRYYANYGSSDNSTAQWPAISMLFASEPGVAAPAFVKNELAYWIEYIQNANGGSGYDSPGNLVNESKTGGLLIEMVLAEDDTLGNPYNLSNTDLLAALGYLNTNWQTTANSTWNGNFGHPYAMWSIYKGLESTIGTEDTTYLINLRNQATSRSGGPAPLDPGVDWTWWEDYCEYLYGTQNVNGSWVGYSSWTGPMAAAWHVNILQGIRIPPPSKCAILGQELVKIGSGSSVTADPSNVCSNGTLRTDADASVDASLLALGDMNLGAGTEVDRDAFTNGSLRTGAEVSIGFADDPLDLDVDAGINLWLGTGTEVEGECQYADTGNLHAGTAAGCGAPPIQVPRPPYPIQNAFVLPECLVTPPAAGAPDIHTPAMSDAYYGNPLTPGDYGTVSFGSNNRVAIEGGEYHFLSLKFGPKTKVEIRGPITVHVVDKLRFADGVQEILAGQVAAKDILYLVDGAADADPEHRGGANTVLLGTFCGPDSTISFGNGTELTGAIIGKEVRLGASVDFTAEPAPVQ